MVTTISTRAPRLFNSSQTLLSSIAQAAVYTGLAVDTLYKMVSQRRIPYVKVGRLVRFDMALLDTWIKQHTVMPMPEK